MVITVAVVSDATIVPASEAANAAAQSIGSSAVSRVTIAWNTASPTTPPSAKFDRLNASFAGAWRSATISATAEPRMSATRYSTGERKNSPMTAGNSDSENECVSRRKCTETTFISAMQKPAAITGHAIENPANGAVRPMSRRA
jgi:hypothetical protein